MRLLPLLFVALALVLSACGHKSDAGAPQVEQGRTVQTAARAWAIEMQPFSRELLDALAEHADFSSDLVGTWGTPQQVPPSRVNALRDHFYELLLRAQALPDGTPEIHAANLALVQGLTLMQAAYDKYLAGLEQANLKLLGQGDNLIQKANAEFTKVLPAIEKVVGGPSEGTIAAEVLKLRPVVQEANIELTQALALNAKMLAAIKHGSLKQATKLAAEAKRHVDRGISRLETLPSPDYDDLKAYLEHTVRGYQLVSNAFSSYAKGLEKDDLELVKEGDHDIRLGLKEINDASEELAQFLRSHSF